MNDPPQRLCSWHTFDLDELATRLETREHGLSQSEAETRLERLGKNRLPQTPPTPLWVIGLRQFKSPLIYILAFATSPARFGGAACEIAK